MALGDLLYRGSALWKRLAGNTTATRKFLSQTGTGVISAVPSWNNVYSEFVSTSTGNIDDLDFNNADVIFMNNATDAIIRGLKAGTDGQRVTIHSKGAGHVFFAHQNTNSAVANRLINSTTIGTTPIAAGAGSATYVYDETTVRWRLDNHFQGAWITPTFDAADYFATGATTVWTVAAGDITNFQYYLTGNKLEINFNITGSTITSTSATELNRNIPNSFQASKGTQLVTIVVDNSTTKVGKSRIAASAVLINWYNDVVTPTAWANAADTTGMLGYILMSLI
jgi:hypothetical protein